MTFYFLRPKERYNIKTEGGKKKLDAYGIQEELRGRLNWNFKI